MTAPAHDAAQRAELCEALLAPLSGHFVAAGEAYAEYLREGKTFRGACRLRQINDAARGLLVSHAHLLTPELQHHASAIVHHYDVWMALWDELAATKPEPDQPFVFENPVRFPRESQRALLDAYEQLRR